MLELRVLTYGGVDIEERFDGLIAQALVKLEPRLHLTWEQEPPATGRVDLMCGASFDGLRGDGYIIEDRESGAFKVVDYQDSDWSPAVQLAPSPFFRGALYAMFHYPRIARLFGNKAPLVHPGWFLDQYPLLTRAHRDEVREVRVGQLDERLFFRGTILRHHAGGTDYSWRGKPFRQVAVVLAEKYPDEVDISDAKLERPEWFLAAAQHRVALTLPGHPWCYREFELFNLGIPLIAYPWQLHVAAGAMPVADMDYVATRFVQRTEPGFAIDPEDGADAIMEAYRVARFAPALLEQIGLAGQAWYDRELSPEMIAAGILQFVNHDGPEWNG